MQLAASEIQTAHSNTETKNKSVPVQSEDLLGFHNLAIVRCVHRTKWTLISFSGWLLLDKGGLLRYCCRGTGHQITSGKSNLMHSGLDSLSWLLPHPLHREADSLPNLGTWCRMQLTGLARLLLTSLLWIHPAAQHSPAPTCCPVWDASDFGPRVPLCSVRQKGHQQTAMSPDVKMARFAAAKCSGFLTSCYEAEKCRCSLILERDFGWESRTKQRGKLSLPVLGV